jgi:aminoglycoside 2''-phosphotransferase
MSQTLDDYRAAIGENFPALRISTLDYLSEGWESVACLVNGHLVFRFPKRDMAQHYLRTEIRLLPELAPHLPLPIPRFDYVADPPGQHVPFAFVGYELLPGTSLNWPDEVLQADWWKPPVGAFLTALHAFPVARARELDVRPISQTAKLTGKAAAPANWCETLSDFYELTQQQAFPLLSDALQRQLARRFERFLAEDRHFAFEPVLVYADLQQDHILLSMPEQQVCGIIDFGDAGIGDPAMDVWPSLLPYYGGQVDETFQARHAFYRQLFPPLNALIFGQVYDDGELVEEGREELAVALDQARGSCLRYPHRGG